MDPNAQLNGIDKLLNLNKLIHERVRLGIMSALSSVDVLSFQELKNILKVTDGNLSVHLKLLEKNNYIVVEKHFIGRKPHSSYSLTNTGKEAFKEYVELLETVIHK